MQYGYARVSTTDQDLSIQSNALKAAGCDVIRSEKVTGTTREGRMELATLLDFIREGDVLVVTRIDRLARSVGDLQDIVRAIKAKGASLGRPSSPSTRAPPRGSAFSICLGSSRSSRPTFDASVRWRASARPRQRVSTRAVSPALTHSRCVFSEIRASVRRTSPSVSRSVGHRSIGCLARQRLPGPRNRSTPAPSLSSSLRPAMRVGRARFAKSVML